MAQDNVRAVIEALLFSSDKPVTIEQMRAVLDNLGPSEVRTILEGMSRECEESNRGVRVVEIAGGFQMVTPTTLAPFLKKFYKRGRPDRLSRPALETLAIIAYKQPVTRMEIELLRNVNVDGVMASLVEKNLIRIVGRRKAPGRPLVYGTTRQFLEYFGLRSLDELPKMEDFSKLSPAAEESTPVEVEPIGEGQTAEGTSDETGEATHTN